MFPSSDRRSALRVAIAAAIAPTFLSSRAFAQGVSGQLIAPPDGPMRYRRSIVRDLSDGGIFRVSREFVVSFNRFDEGYMLQGEQQDVSTEAPTALSRFAEIESARDESHLFPIALDPFGHIRSEMIVGRGMIGLDQAVNEAFTMLERQQIANSERESVRQFVSAVHAAGQEITAYLPVDLFSPVETPRTEGQEITLPDGGLGLVETRFSGELDASTGLMRAAEREIVTEVDGSRRTTSEHWSLARI